MTEGASPMHGEAQGAAVSARDVPCDACAHGFTPKKRWQRFCSPKCRNDWHQWTKTVREARELVRMVLAGEADPTTWNPRARKLLGIK